MTKKQKAARLDGPDGEERAPEGDGANKKERTFIIPPTLQKINRWLIHKNKKPRVKWQDGANLISFQNAKAGVRLGTGLGFVFTTDDDLGGVDLDACRDPATGEMKAWAQEIVDKFRSYTEVSPSGTGVKIYAAGAPSKLPTNSVKMGDKKEGEKTPAIEAFVTGRFFAVTGQHLEGTPKDVQSCTEAWKWLVEKMGGGEKKMAPSTGGFFDADLVQDALAAIPADDYDVWVLVLAALKHSGGEDAFQLALEWSKKSEKFQDEQQVKDKWDSFERRGDGEDVAGLGTVFRLAVEHGWERPSVNLRTDEPVHVARRFGEDVGDLWYWRGDFHQWTGHTWRPLSTDDLKARLYTWLEHAKVKTKGKTKRYRPDRAKVANVLDALAGVRHLEDNRDAPFWTEEKDGDPDAGQLVPFRNGTLILNNFALREPDARLFALHAVDCDFAPKAKAPRWERFLAEIFPGDEQSARCVEEILGYCLTSDTSFQKAFLFQGRKRSGKGTILRVLRALVGAERYAGPTVASFSQPFGLQGLMGKTVAAIADARGHDRSDPHVVVERLLAITGEDTLSIDRKYRSHCDCRLPTRIIYVSNVPPKLRDASGVIVSRFVAVNFQQSFEGREDPHLERALLAELPGIVNRALTGLKRLRERGRFEQPDTGRELLEQMDENTGTVRSFVRDLCEVGPEHQVETDLLYSEFREWCRKHGHQVMAANTFGSDLFALGEGIRKKRHQVNGTRKILYSGVQLAPSVEGPV